MSELHCGPITPSNIINDPRYLRELEVKKPKPRIRIEDKWIKDINEKGSVGILFELQGLESKLQELQLIQRERSKMQSATAIPSCRSGRHKIPINNNRKMNFEQFVPDKKFDSTNETDTANGNFGTKILLDQTESIPFNKQQSTAQNRTYLKAHENSGPPLNVDDYPPIQKINLQNSEKVQVSVPTGKSAVSVKFQRRQINYIRANAYALQSDRYRGNLKSATSTRQIDMSNYKKGEVPKYLKDFKIKSEEKERERASSNLIISKDRVLTGVEKQRILQKLKLDLENIYSELNSLPISMETIRSRTRKGQLEKQLDEIKKHIDIFNKPRVYVMN